MIVFCYSSIEIDLLCMLLLFHSCSLNPVRFNGVLFYWVIPELLPNEVDGGSHWSDSRMKDSRSRSSKLVRWPWAVSAAGEVYRLPLIPCVGATDACQIQKFKDSCKGRWGRVSRLSRDEDTCTIRPNKIYFMSSCMMSFKPVASLVMFIGPF